MPQDLTDNKSTLDQVMAWCRQATSHYLSQYWLSSLSPYGVARPQWVNLHMHVITLCLTAQSCLIAFSFPFTQRMIYLMMSTCFAKKIKVLQIKNVVCLFPDSISCIESHCLYLIKRVAFASILGWSELKWPTAMKKDWRLSTTVAGKFGIQTYFTILLGLHLIVIWVSTWLSTAISSPFSVILDIRLQHRWAFAVVSHTLCKKRHFACHSIQNFVRGDKKGNIKPHITGLYMGIHRWPVMRKVFPCHGVSWSQSTFKQLSAIITF